MKVDLQANGCLVVSAETPMEDYALKHWANEAFIPTEDITRNEQLYVRGSKLIVQGLVPEDKP